MTRRPHERQKMTTVQIFHMRTHAEGFRVTSTLLVMNIMKKKGKVDELRWGGRVCNELHGLFVFLVFFFCTFSSYVDYTFLSSLIRKKKVEIKKGSERSNQKKKKEEEKHTHGRENNITGFKEEEENKKKNEHQHTKENSQAHKSHTICSSPAAKAKARSKRQLQRSVLLFMRIYRRHRHTHRNHNTP